MNPEFPILILEAMAIYFLVLWTHSLRHRFGLAYFYALIGGLTAVMSWVTDAGVRVEVMGITFMVGSTVFYTALLLSAFVVYVFDGPRAARIVIAIIVGVSIFVPLIAATLYFQMKMSHHTLIGHVPIPSFRINAASVMATLLDLIFLAMSWEFLGNERFRLNLWLRVFITLLGVMWLDVALFATGAFSPGPEYIGIIKGSLLSRLIISIFACPFLYIYFKWQSVKKGMEIENRPILAILRQVAEIKKELTLAQQEIEQRKTLEREREKLIAELQQALSEIKTLQGFLPICANCKKIRDDEGYWQQIEKYIQDRSDAQFSHSICPDCAKKLYPDLNLS